MLSNLSTMFSLSAKAAIQVFIFYFLASSMAPADFGIIVVNASIALMISPLIACGYDYLIVRESSRSQSCALVCARKAAVTCLYGMPVFLAFSLMISYWSNAIPAGLVHLIALLIVSELLAAKLTHISVCFSLAIDDRSGADFVRIFPSLLRMSALMIFQVMNEPVTIQVWIFVVGISSILQLLYLVHKRLLPIGRAAGGGSSVAVISAIQYGLGAFSVKAKSESDKVIVSRYLGAEAAANLAVASRIVDILFIPIQAHLTNGMKQEYRRWQTQRQFSVPSLVRPLLLYGVFAALIAVAIGAYLLPVFLPEYVPAQEMLQLICAMPFVMGLRFQVNVLLTAISTPGRYVLLCLATTSVGVSIGLLLVPHIGWKGAIVGLYLTDIGFIAIGMYTAQRAVR